MSGQTFDPVNEFISVRNKLSNTVKDAFKNLTRESFFPAMDIYETESAVTIDTAPMWGLIASTLEISVQANVLTITGETESQSKISSTQYLLRELPSGKFSRSVSIAVAVNSKSAKAKLKENRLTITLPKANISDKQIVDITPTK
jgi:HSP20 family protein